MLDQRIDWIPFGWQRLYGDLRSKLKAVRSPRRDAVFVQGAYEHHGYLHVEAVTDDKVLQGILRKARAKATFTCMACARQGRPRDVGDTYMSLCGACAGYVALREDAQTARKSLRPLLLGTVEQDGQNSLLKAAVCASLRSTAGVREQSEVSSETFMEWLDAILVVLDQLLDGARP
ncbi:hypothetical protein ACPWT1_02810 [Ramlibacter sp. MMS24-I3-19]|uniref:hypothetical protein n=1 Tax=Ramlibacter sp. MMS24-I3-19 TaxID=3416606 RepID=UPI003D02674E